MLFKALTVAAAATLAVAQRPANESMCDYYTTALLKNNTAANQKTLLTLVVNTAVIGNYTTPNVGIAVPGILNPNGTFNGTAVNLVPYFSGALASTNTGGSVGVSVNFLDDGGAAPLEKNMPANTNSSAQYTLLTHLYEYFGDLLGCSLEGTGDYPAYAGKASMYEVHKFMDLSYAEVSYFIEQVGLSAASFGVTTADVTAVGEALTDAFNVRCAPPTTIIPAQGAQLQSICIDSTCPLAANATCSDYAAAVKPSAANTTTTNSTASSTGSMTSSTAMASSTVSVSSATTFGFSFAAVVGGVFAALL